jgi:hypothetical protein
MNDGTLAKFKAINHDLTSDEAELLDQLARQAEHVMGITATAYLDAVVGVLKEPLPVKEANHEHPATHRAAGARQSGAG